MDLDLSPSLFQQGRVFEHSHKGELLGLFNRPELAGCWRNGSAVLHETCGTLPKMLKHAPRIQETQENHSCQKSRGIKIKVAIVVYANLGGLIFSMAEIISMYSCLKNLLEDPF